MSKLEPLVAAPHSPDNRKTAHECSSTKIDRVYIGCVVAVERYDTVATEKSSWTLVVGRASLRGPN